MNGTYEDNKDSIIKKELSTKGIFGMDIKENLMNYIRNIESERIVEENFRYLKEHPAIRYCVSLMADISKEIDYVRSIFLIIQALLVKITIQMNLINNKFKM